MNMDRIGGGEVVRGFTSGTEWMRPGTQLSREFLCSIPVANRNVLIDKEFIQVWPRAGQASPAAAAGASGAESAERHVVSLGFGRYSVIVGTVLNDTPLDQEEAYALAGKPVPMKERKQS